MYKNSQKFKKKVETPSKMLKNRQNTIKNVKKIVQNVKTVRKPPKMSKN